MNKRFLSLLLAFVMVVSLLPTAAFAAVGGEDAIPMAAPAAHEDTLSTPAAAVDAPEQVPAAAEDDVPVVLAAANAEATTYDYGGTVTATAPSYQAPSGANSLAAALDGDTTTWWHTAWNNNGGGTSDLTDLSDDPDNRYIQLNLNESISLDGLRYLSRAAETNPADFGNGVVMQYRIEVSTDGTTFTPVAAGTWEPGASAWRVAVFPESVSAKYVRLYGVRTYGNGEGYSTPTQTNVNVYMSAAELRLLSGVPADWRPTNLARLEGVTAEDDHHEEGDRDNGEHYNLNGAQAIDGVKTGSENNNSGHWSTDQGVDIQRTLIVDLHRNCDIDQIKLFWKNASVYTYTVSTSSDKQTWNTVYTQDTRVSIDSAGELVPVFSHNTGVRYVRLQATANRGEGNAYWGNVNLWEIEIYGTAGKLITDETPDGNLCRPTDGVTVTATAKSVENGTAFTADKTIDGDTTTKPSRWSSANNSEEQWLQIDLGALRTVSLVKLFWERTNVTAYTLQVSTDNTNWTTVHTCSSRITQTTESLSFTPTAARYIKINVTGHDDQGASTYRNIALYEVEVYRDENAVPQDASTVLANLQAVSGGPLEVNAAGTKVVLKQAALDLVPESFTVTFAANLEQVVGAGGTIYTPVVDKAVTIDLTVTDSNDPDNTASTPANAPISITIPGTHNPSENAGGNPKPAVIPEIMEWYSHGTDAKYKDQSYTIPEEDQIRILYRYAFTDVAKELQADLEDLYGMTAELVRLTGSFSTLQDGTVQGGDIVLFDVAPNSNAEDPRNRVKGYDDETYGMEIFEDTVYIYATHPTGAYWGTRTLLQGMRLSADGRSFPNGTLRDYPEFKVRGFVMDVARKPMSMDLLQNIVKNMAWYKLNDFHVHLNDNLIFMEDYGVNANNYTDPAIYAQANDAYSAFRLESDIQEEAGGNPLTAKDYAYTKAEFKQFIKDSAAIGINIVPEFDAPAHAKSIADAFPSLRLQGVWGGQWGYNHPANCHLDLTNKYAESLAVVQEIFDEYLDGSDPVFTGDVIHIGADEYFGGGTPYRKFMRDMIAYAKEKGKTPRIWGSLSHSMIASSDSTLQFNDVELNKGVQMNIWNTGWANPTVMYEKGFDLINITDGPFYMVPSGGGGRGGYGDYLNLTDIYNKAPNNIGNAWFPASSSQILGSAFAIWDDDMTDTHSKGLDEVDVFDRFFDALPVTAVRQWGVENKTPARTLTELQADIAKIGVAPQTKPYFEADETDFVSYDFSATDDKPGTADKSGNAHDLKLTNAEVNDAKSLLVLKGGASYAETGLSRLSWGNQLSFRALKLTGGGEEQILFEADHAYGDYAIKALPVEGDTTKWKLGFSRELHDYEFDVELPVGEWVRLTLTTAQQTTKLSVNGGVPVAAVGKLVAKPDSNTQFMGKTGITNSSFELPVARIGSKTNAFDGYVAAVTTGEAILEVPFMNASSPTFNSDGIPFKAIDGDPSTIYHSNYTESAISTNGPFFKDLPAEQRYIQLDLAVPATVSGLKHLRRQNGTNGYITSYDIRVSTDGETYTSVKTGSGWSASNDWDTATFDAVANVCSVRLYRTDTSGEFMSVAELELIYDPITLTGENTSITVGDALWSETEDGGMEATANVTVVFKPNDNAPLFKETDYTVSYENNTDEAGGTATLIVTGKGCYGGSVRVPFPFPAKPVVVDLSTATVTFAQTSYPLENGKAEPEPIVKVGNTTLLRGLDYDVTYENNTAEGTATVTLTAMGNCTGEKTANFTVIPAIVKKNLSDTAKTKVTLSQTTFPYDGGAITPEPVVTYDGETLTKGTHYTLSYARNNAVGTATVTVTGVAPYCEGRVSATFTIVEPSKGNDLGDVTKTVVTLKATQYEYTGKPIIPEFTVRYNGVRLTQGTDFTVELKQNVNGGNGVLVIYGKGDYYGSYIATFTIVGGGTGAGDNTGSSSSGNGSSVGIPSPVVTSTETTKGDGVTTTIKTDSTGAMIAQSTYDDGTKVIADIPVIGPVTAVVTVPSRVDAVTVTIPTRGEPAPGQVAVILHPDGTEEIVKTSLPTEGGLELTLDASATIQIVDNTKTFTDVPADNWAKDAIDFVTSREIFNGTGNSTFTPTGGMSRAMVCTVLANLAGEDTKGGATWYEKAVDWAQQSGVSDGSAPDAIVTREQLAAMLYRYAGSPSVVNEVPRRFRDRNSVSDWAELAVTWAVENDLIRGRSSDDGLDLAPQATASRAEVAAVFQRYVALLK